MATRRRRSSSRKSSSEQCLYEPSPTYSPSSAPVEGHFYIWGGENKDFRENKLSLEEYLLVQKYDPYLETWTQLNATGHPPAGFVSSACASTGQYLYTYGGWDGLYYDNSLHRLDTRTSAWAKLPSGGPMRKHSCGMVVCDNKLVLFGGIGIPSDLIQPRSEFILDKDADDGHGWTNELHTYDFEEQVWSSPSVSGRRPPPCTGFSLTAIDSHRAALFGGSYREKELTNDVYIIDLARMQWSKLDGREEEPCPVRRVLHSAVCLGQGGNNPQLLVTGGIDDNEETLGDVWLLDLRSGRWKQVTVPCLQSRNGHCAAAFCVSPSLVEVTIFGGCSAADFSTESLLANTTILRFCNQECVSTGGVCTKEWVLTDVADNSQRGTSLRVKEKMVKMKENARQAEMRSEEAEEKARAAQRRVMELEERVRRAGGRIEIGEGVQEAEHEVVDGMTGEVDGRAEERLREADRRATEAERRMMEMADRCARHEQRARVAEERADNVERQWVVESREVHITEEVLGGGGWGEVKVAEFRGIRVAAKSLYQAIRSGYYQQLFIREMNMAARVRHPNLVQFIGACMEGEMVILTELLPTSLRRELEREGYHMSPHQLLSISLDVIRALNYLHQMQPDPIIHRDISSANVLLEPLADSRWRAKVTDYGSVHFQQQLRTFNPGCPVYSAPEADRPALQSPKMDIFSFGVLLVEMCTAEFPEVSAHARLIASIQDREWVGLIHRCTQHDKDDRPPAAEIIPELQQRMEATEN